MMQSCARRANLKIRIPFTLPSPLPPLPVSHLTSYLSLAEEAIPVSIAQCYICRLVEYYHGSCIVIVNEIDIYLALPGQFRHVSIICTMKYNTAICRDTPSPLLSGIREWIIINPFQVPLVEKLNFELRIIKKLATMIIRDGKKRAGMPNAKVYSKNC